jgi:hypothetical protein
MRQEDGSQRLSNPLETVAHRSALGHRQQAIDSDHARTSLDEIRVDEGSLGLRGKAVDGRFVRHGFLLIRVTIPRPWDSHDGAGPDAMARDSPPDEGS